MLNKQSNNIHVADVSVNKRGYAAKCGTCGWVGPEHEGPDAAIADAQAHEANPKPKRDPSITLRKIRRRL